MSHKIPEVRLRHLAGQVHALGPRSFFELVREVARGEDIVERLEVFARLDPAIVAAIGADVLPPSAAVMKPQS